MITNAATKKARLFLDANTGKWTAEYQGHILAASYNKEYVVEKIRTNDCRRAQKFGIVDVEEVGEIVTAQPDGSPILDDAEDDALEFDINTRFEFMETLVQMVVDRTIPSLVITGEGGLGKTFVVKQVLKDNKLQDAATFDKARSDVEIELAKARQAAEEAQKAAEKANKRRKKGDEEDEESQPGGMQSLAQVEELLKKSRELATAGDFVFVKGYSTAKALYRTLFENNGKIIVFDDCDSIQKDSTAVNILKAAADSYDERWVDWRSENPFSDLPRSFMFTGQIVFISNMPYHRLDQAIRSRSMCVDLSMTVEQKLERMARIIESPEFMASSTEATIEFKREALAFMIEKKHLIRDLNMRSLISTVKIRMGDKPNWRQLAEFILRTNA